MSPESVTCKVIALKSGKATAGTVILQMKRGKHESSWAQSKP